MADKKKRTIEYKGYKIIQVVEWKKNPMDGDGNEVRTFIHQLPKYSGFIQLAWLNKDVQKKRIVEEMDKAKYHIDLDVKNKQPTIFDELGFETFKE
jgi:hypothetical protein